MIIQRGDMEKMPVPLLIMLIENCWLTLQDIEDELGCYAGSCSAASQFYKLEMVRDHFKVESENSEKNIREHGTPEMIKDMEEKRKFMKEHPPSSDAFLEWKH